DPVEEAEPDLLPDLRGWPRGGAGGCRSRPQTRLRLLLPLLPRPRALSAARHDREGDAALGGGLGRGSQLGRPADAQPLGAQAAPDRVAVEPAGGPVPPRPRPPPAPGP